MSEFQVVPSLFQSVWFLVNTPQVLQKLDLTSRNKSVELFLPHVQLLSAAPVLHHTEWPGSGTHRWNSVWYSTGTPGHPAPDWEESVQPETKATLWASRCVSLGFTCSLSYTQMVIFLYVGVPIILGIWGPLTLQCLYSLPHAQHSSRIWFVSIKKPYRFASPTTLQLWKPINKEKLRYGIDRATCHFISLFDVVDMLLY